MGWLTYRGIGEYDSKLASEREQRQKVLEEHDQKIKALQGTNQHMRMFTRGTDAFFALDRWTCIDFGRGA